MNAVKDFKGTCHCGAVRFTVRLTDGLRSARRGTKRVANIPLCGLWRFAELQLHELARSEFSEARQQ